MSCKLALLFLFGLVALAVAVPVENTAEDAEVESVVAYPEKAEAPLEETEAAEENDEDDIEVDEPDNDEVGKKAIKSIWRFGHRCSNPRARCFPVRVARKLKQRCYIRTMCCGHVCRYQSKHTKSCGFRLQRIGCFQRHQCFWYRTDYYYKN